MANNKLISLTDLSSLDSLQHVDIQDNYFDFRELENSGIDWSAIPSYSKYAPQKAFLPLVTDTTNNEVTLSVIDNHSNNYYKWIKNGELLNAGPDSTLTYDESDENSYYCKISNSNFPDLILQTKAVGKNIKNGVIKSDYNALTEIYNQTEGQNWKNNDNWLSDTIANKWHGVSIKGERVSELRLSSNNLTGELPKEIFDLDKLTYLNLYNNNLTGKIPSEIGNLSNLNMFACSKNSLSGEIPKEISNLSNLSYLYLNRNQFNKLPDMSSMESLYGLFIENNCFDFNDLEEANIHWSSFTNESLYAYAPQDTITLKGISTGSQYTFTVKDEKGNALKDAKINIGAVELTTNENGQATFNATKGSFNYTVSLEDYADQTGNLVVTEGAVSEEIAMAALEYMITFRVSDKNENAIESAAISIGNKTLETNENGVATIDTVNGTYDYTVSANGFQDHENSVEVNGEKVTKTITLSETATNINANRNNGLKIYPNPASENIYIESHAKVTSMKLMTLQGQIIIHKKPASNITNMKVAQLQSGYYLLQVKFNNNKKEVRQVIVR